MGRTYATSIIWMRLNRRWDFPVDNYRDNAVEDHRSSQQGEGARCGNWSVTRISMSEYKSRNEEKRNEDQKCVSPAHSD